jgi:FkbH-like protein
MSDLSRERVDELIAQSEVAAAQALLVDVWRSKPGPATAAFVAGRFEEIEDRLGFPSCRVAILRSFTLEPVVPLLRALAFVSGIAAEVQVGQFGTYVRDLLDADSELYRFQPDVVILAVQTRDVAPDLWDRFADLGEAEVDRAVADASDLYRSLIASFRSHSSAHLVVHGLELPVTLARGILDGQTESGQARAVRRANEAIVEAAREHTNVYVLDYDELVASRGRSAWHDERKWLSARMPIAASELIHLANEWMRFLQPITGRICKVLAVDLDGTLWGGVIGEDGINGIHVGPELPGAPYQALQRAMLDLYRRGVVLAVCSKNNPAEALEAIAEHPGMLVRPEHFSAIRINWADKAQNLQEIADELNVGIDSVAFLDDNPVEREWVRSQLPSLTVIDLPDDPMEFASTVVRSPVFERLELTDEDRVRSRYYAQERMRSELERSAVSLEDFYRSLEMAVEIESVKPKTLARAAQLTQKTNQFNLTTRRYSEQELDQLIKSADWHVYTLRAGDRFGDSGIVGVAITRQDDGVCEIDTFLLSCRVIGRTIETAFLATIAEKAEEAGIGKLVGWFIPTGRNAPASRFYEDHGFIKVAETDGGSRWELDVEAKALSSPPWIERRLSGRADER